MTKLPRLCFCAERQVGIGSAAAALEPYVRRRENASWTDVTYVQPGGLVERLPLVPERVRGTLRGYLQTRAALRAEKFDAFFFLTHNPAVLHQHSVRRTPTLLWTDVTPRLLDVQAEHYGHRLDSSRLQDFKDTLVRRTFTAAALCVGWSDWARRSFVADYDVPRQKTEVVPPGVDLSRWTLAPRDEHEPRPTRLLFVGGNFARKGGELLLEVFRAHFADRAELDVVTRDSIAAERGVRIHRGLNADSPELMDLYRRADVFVLPTRGDCFSIASLEAMATGLPVIVSAVGGIREIFETPEQGSLVPPEDGRALREALEALIDDPARAKRIGLAARARVEQRFDAERCSAQLFELLEVIADEERA